MPHYKRAIVALDGHSSKIKDENILINVRYALNALHIPFSIYEPHTEGLKKLEQEMNEPDTLYILNDSFQFHLCEKPNILISRTPQWVQSTPKPSTIGVFTQQMLSVGAEELIACIARNKPVRQHHDLFAATNYILANEYLSGDTSVMARNGLAMFSWHRLIDDDMHTCVISHQSEGLPLVNEMLKEGMEMLSHPDDILIVLNRDICLVPEATGILRTYMDLHDAEAVYAKRVDVLTDSLLTFHSIQKFPEYEGIDLFAFRKDSPVAYGLMEVPLRLGRAAWDNFWAHRIGRKLPYKIAYHHIHESKWQTKEGEEGNALNLYNISIHRNSRDLGVEHYESHFKAIK